MAAACQLHQSSGWRFSDEFCSCVALALSMKNHSGKSEEGYTECSGQFQPHSDKTESLKLLVREVFI